MTAAPSPEVAAIQRGMLVTLHQVVDGSLMVCIGRVRSIVSTASFPGAISTIEPPVFIATVDVEGIGEVKRPTGMLRRWQAAPGDRHLVLARSAPARSRWQPPGDDAA